jgi:Protein of unknown function (DUF2905)
MNGNETKTNYRSPFDRLSANGIVYSHHLLQVITMAKWLIVLGVLLILIGLIWPWLSKLGIGHLPGDIHIRRAGFDFYFPLTSSIVVSLVLSLLFWIFRK